MLLIVMYLFSRGLHFKLLTGTHLFLLCTYVIWVCVPGCFPSIAFTMPPVHLLIIQFLRLCWHCWLILFFFWFFFLLLCYCYCCSLHSQPTKSRAYFSCCVSPPTSDIVNDGQSSADFPHHHLLPHILRENLFKSGLLLPLTLQ